MESTVRIEYRALTGLISNAQFAKAALSGVLVRGENKLISEIISKLNDSLRPIVGDPKNLQPTTEIMTTLKTQV